MSQRTNPTTFPAPRTRCPGRALPALALAALPAFLACGGAADGDRATTVDSAGVAVVTNPGPDRALEWTVREVLRIPPLEDEGDGFFGAQEVAVLDGRRIAVLDPDAKRVVVYDEEGTFLAQYGREGSGPGEFQMPFQMVALPGGGVGVYDVMNRRMERFDADLEPRRPDPMRVEYYGGHMDYAGDFLVAPTRTAMNPEVNEEALMAMGSADTVEVVRHAREVGGVVTLESCGMSVSGMGPLFEARTRWAAGPDGKVAVTGTGRYEVDVYRAPDFTLERRIRREVPVIRATEEIAAATVGDGMRVMAGGQERVCDAGEVVEQRGFAPEIPPTESMAFAPSGELYVERWAPPGEEHPIDVFGPAGEYLGTLAPAFPFPDAFLDDDRIVVIEEDELGLTSVVVYGIER